MHKPPTYSHLKVLGCLCYVNTPNPNGKKFDSWVVKCIFLGYKIGIKGYKVMDLVTRKVFLSQDVYFYEDLFPLLSPQNSLLVHPKPSLGTPSFVVDFLMILMAFLLEVLKILMLLFLLMMLFMILILQFILMTLLMLVILVSGDLKVFGNTTDVATNANVSHIIPSTVLRRSIHAYVAPKNLAEYECRGMHNLKVNTVTNSLHMLAKVFSYAKLSPGHYAFSSKLDNIVLPSSYAEVLKHACWRATFKVEIDALVANNIWQVIDLPPGKVPIDCTIVYRIKYKANEDIDRYKIRIVAKGFTQ